MTAAVPRGRETAVLPVPSKANLDPSNLDTAARACTVRPVEDPTRAQPLIEVAINLAAFHLFIRNYTK